MSYRHILPMPIPGLDDAPKFKGKRVTDFLDELEYHASVAQISCNDLPGHVLRYCSRKVRFTVEAAPCWTQNDWPAACAYLIKLYGSNDRKPRITIDKFRKWIKHHSRDQDFKSLQDVDEYYREFMAQSTPLLDTLFLTTHEANLLFFSGIPKALHRDIRDLLPEACRTVQSPPQIDVVLALLRKEFDEDDIFQENDSDLSSDLDESDSDLSDANYCKTRRKPKKNVKYSTDPCFTALPPPTATFAVPLPSQEVSFDVQPYQGSVPGLDDVSACQTRFEDSERSPAPTPEEEQAIDDEDLNQADAEDDASQQVKDTIYGDVVIETNLNTLISLPLKHVLVDSTEAVHHLSVRDGHSLAYDVPRVLEPLDDIPIDNYKELDVSIMATAPPAHEYQEEKSDNNAVYYCMALKIQARRQVTGSATKRAEFQFLPSFKSQRANDAFFSTSFYTASMPPRSLSFLLFNQEVPRCRALEANPTTTGDNDTSGQLYIDINHPREVTFEKIPNDDARQSSQYQSTKLPSNGQVIRRKTLSDISPSDPRSTSSILVGFSQLLAPSSRLFPAPHPCAVVSTRMLLITFPQELRTIPQCSSGKDPPGRRERSKMSSPLFMPLFDLFKKYRILVKSVAIAPSVQVFDDLFENRSYCNLDDTRFQAGLDMFYWFSYFLCPATLLMPFFAIFKPP
jgi:hypothetical protein